MKKLLSIFCFGAFTKRISKMFLLALLVLIIWTSTGMAAVSGEADLEKQMLDLVNKERSTAGLAPLKMDAKLVDVARLKSKDMIDKNYFSHTSPTYGDPFAMMKDYGVDYSMAGENLAGNSSLPGAHEALMNSPGHRANILKPEFTHIGIGVVKGGPYGMMITQMFIKSRSDDSNPLPVKVQEIPTPAPIINESVNKKQIQPRKDDLQIFYNAKEITFPDIKPYINENERIMVPLRFISQELGYRVEWEMVDQKIIIKKDENSMNLWIDKKLVFKNNQLLISDSSPEIRQSRTMVPLRLVSELFGGEVVWYPTLNKAVINHE